MMFNEFDDLLTVDEMCEALKIGHNMTYRLLGDGTIKALRRGRIWRIPRQAIIKFILGHSKL